jgi:hypothetical protein
MNAGILIVFMAGCIAGCKVPGEVDASLLVANLRFSPAAFDSFKANTEIRYSLEAPAAVSCMIVRRGGATPDLLVTTLCSAVYESKGAHAHTWLGDTNAGLFAPAGDYIGILAVRDHRYEATVRIFHF